MFVGAAILAVIMLLWVLVVPATLPIAYRLTRVELKPPVPHDEHRIRCFTPGPQAAVLYYSVSSTVTPNSNDREYFVCAYDYSGELLALRHLSERQVPLPLMFGSRLTYLEGTGFVYFGKWEETDEGQPSAYIVVASGNAEDGSNKDSLTEILGVDPERLFAGPFFSEIGRFMLISYGTRELLVYDFTGAGFEEVSRISFGERGIVPSRFFGWGNHVVWLRGQYGAPVLNLESLSFVEDAALYAELRADVGQLMQDDGWIVLGARNRFAVGYDFVPSRWNPSLAFLKLRTSRCRLFIHSDGSTVSFIEFDYNDPLIQYNFRRRLGHPTPTDLVFTEPIALSSGPIVLYDGIAQELLLLKPK